MSEAPARVLIVEDDAEIAEMLRSLLDRDAYRATTVADGAWTRTRRMVRPTSTGRSPRTTVSTSGSSGIAPPGQSSLS